jgi:hypothetical protein
MMIEYQELATRSYLGEEVDAYSRLIHIIKRVVHKACDQGCLADYDDQNWPWSLMGEIEGI